MCGWAAVERSEEVGSGASEYPRGGGGHPQHQREDEEIGKQEGCVHRACPVCLFRVFTSLVSSFLPPLFCRFFALPRRKNVGGKEANQRKKKYADR